MSTKEDLITTLGYVNDVRKALSETSGNSLIEYTSVARVEPIVLMDNSLTNLTFMPDVMQSITSIFSGYYLQAIALTMNVGKVDVIKLLDKVNPNRDPWIALESKTLDSHLEQKDSYAYRLPTRDSVTLADLYDEPALEAKNSTSIGRDTLQILKTPSNLAVGKMLEVNVENEGSKATFPVSVRLVPVLAMPKDVVTTLTLGSKDKTFWGRYHQWKAGQIDFVKDLVLCQDLINDHKKALIKDPSGIYRQSASRKTKGLISTLLSGNISVATASNIIVISEETKKKIEIELNMRFKDFRSREKFFKDTYGMLMVVVDPEWEGITVYHRSIEAPSNLSSSDMKTVGSSNVDVGEILKAYQLGNAPKF